MANFYGTMRAACIVECRKPFLQSNINSSHNYSLCMKYIAKTTNQFPVRINAMYLQFFKTFKVILLESTKVFIAFFVEGLQLICNFKRVWVV